MRYSTGMAVMRERTDREMKDGVEEEGQEDVVVRERLEMRRWSWSSGSLSGHVMRLDRQQR